MADRFYDFDGEGFEDLEKILKEYVKNMEEPINILEVGVSEFVKDVRRLPKPRSKMSSAGYTHLLDTVTYQKKNGEIEVGWGKYYGPMVERGTVKMSGTPHLAPTFEMNKEKYYKKMIKQIGG